MAGEPSIGKGSIYTTAHQQQEAKIQKETKHCSVYQDCKATWEPLCETTKSVTTDPGESKTPPVFLYQEKAGWELSRQCQLSQKAI